MTDIKFAKDWKGQDLLSFQVTFSRYVIVFFHLTISIAVITSRKTLLIQTRQVLLEKNL